MTNVTKTAGDASVHTTIIEKELSYTIVGCAMQVYNELGYGFAESVYAKSLLVLFTAKGLLVEREYPVEVVFRGVVVGTYRIDMLVERRISLEIKSTERLSEVTHRQLRNYLSAAKIDLGLILHFGPRLASHRVLAPWVVP